VAGRTALSDNSPISSRLRRTTRLGSLVAAQSSRVAAGAALDKIRSEEARERAQTKRTMEVVEQIVVQLGRMKGAAMKIGQVLSTVEFPGLEVEGSERIQRRLAELRDAAPSVPWPRLEKLMQQEWGEPVARVLADIEKDAMAAASIGQVHRATLRDGTRVAIKVQYPGIAEAVDADLRNLRLLMPLLARIAPALDTRALADELRERITEELDYELESASHRRVWRLWRDHPHILVPRVDTEHSTRRILVTELHEGMRFDDLKNAEEARRDRTAEIVHRFYYVTAADHDLALGDPHPGNWQSLDDGRVVVFDFGMLRDLPRGHVRREGPAVRAIHEQDADALFASMRELGYLGPDGADFTDRRQLLLAHMTIAAAWLMEDQPFRLSPAVQREMAEQLLALGPPWRAMVRQFSLPRESVLLRRMADLLFTGFCQLRAAADWWALAQELQIDGEPRTELGREHASWAQGR
jgi:predicted unusual protein kinase regulating ubiquinone biosynthesis (AarF/ABC1/UbiB family)